MASAGKETDTSSPPAQAAAGDASSSTAAPHESSAPAPTSAPDAPRASSPAPQTSSPAPQTATPAAPAEQPTGDATDIVPAIEPDDARTDSDSAFGDGSESYTTSLASSILDYKYENGRRYHRFRDGEYPLPNDEKEQDRLDLIHHLHNLILDGKLHLASIGRNPGRVLDVGTGTGIWAIDFADEYPSAEVIGTDLSPIQPPWVPPNLKFEVDDAESEWTHATKFDYIHLRTLGGSFKDVPKLLRQCYNNLNPGGWIEWQEYQTIARADDNSIPPNSAMLEWVKNLNEAAETFGKVMNVAPLIKGHVEDVGFTNVQEVIKKIPMSPWAKAPHYKELGKWNLLAMLDSLQAYTLRLFTNVLHWEPVRAEVLIANVRKELLDPRIHFYST
ncbi:MAG: hypothetical protein M1815_005757 [Lichina confinis]|nr:MAG: hypothetical protein M1815_005757 [Lichina confinis]